MARRSDHSRTELYGLAMDAAREIVERDGLRGLTARRVADAIGYSPGTLYNLFANLDEMTLRLNGGTLDALFEAISETKRTGDPVTDVRAMLRAFLTFLEQNPALWNAVFEFMMPSDHNLPDWYRDKVMRLIGLIESAIAPLFADGREVERLQAAGVLWSSLHGICTLAREGRLSLVSNQALPEMAESLVVNYLTGLQNRAAGTANHA